MSWLTTLCNYVYQIFSFFENISVHSLSFSNLGNKLSYCRSLIHQSSFQSLSPSYFTLTSFLPFSDATPWIFPIFNYIPFSLFTTHNTSLSQNTQSSISFHQSLLDSIIQHTVPLDLQVDPLLTHTIPSLNHSLFHQIIDLMAGS